MKAKLFEEEETFNTPYELPEGWRWVRLGEVVNPRREIVEPQNFNLYDIYVGLEHISSNSINLSSCSHPQEVKSSKNKFRKGDILYGKLRPYLNKVVVSNVDGICSTDILVLIPNHNVDPKYTAFFLKSSIFLQRATRTMSGTNLPRTSWAKIKNLLIPLPFKDGKPDLEKQKRIVEKIETLFSKIDQAIKLRQRALEETKKLFESVLNKIFREAEEDKEGWRWVRLGEVAEIIMGQSPPSSTYNGKGIGLPFYQGKKDFGEKFLNPSSIWCSDPKKIATPNDILISVRAPVGNVNITKFKCAIGRGLAIIRPKDEKVVRYYLFNYLKLIEPRWRGKGSTFDGVTKEILQTLLIPLPFKNNQPDLEKQKQIAEYLDNLHEKIKRLEQLQKEQLEKFQKLKESILNKAFRGELV